MPYAGYPYPSGDRLEGGCHHTTGARTGDAEANGISDREHLGIQTAHPSGFERVHPGSSEIEDAPSASLAVA